MNLTPELKRELLAASLSDIEDAVLKLTVAYGNLAAARELMKLWTEVQEAES